MRCQSLYCREISWDAAVAVHPGMVQTDLAHGWLEGSDIFGSLQSFTAVILRALASVILEPSQAAAQTILYAACAPTEEASL